MPTDHILARRLVEAECLHAAVVIDSDMTVLPGDLREPLLRDLARAPSQRVHLLFADAELPLHQIPGHHSSSFAGGKDKQREVGVQALVCARRGYASEASPDPCRFAASTPSRMEHSTEVISGRSQLVQRERAEESVSHRVGRN